MTSPMRPAVGSGNATILVYLSLFLLLLVFFIVLNAHSLLRGYRVQAVLSSVGHSFSAPGGAGGGMRGEEQMIPGSPAAVSIRRLRELGDLFETEIGVAKVETVDAGSRGRVMVVSMAADQLFMPGTPVVRQSQTGLLDRVARTLADRRGGVWFELDFLLAFGSDPPARQPAPDPVVRAASFARTLINDGAPPAAVSVGLEPGPAGTVRLLFSSHTTAGGSHAPR